MLVFECNTVEELREEIASFVSKIADREYNYARFSKTQKDNRAHQHAAAVLTDVAESIRRALLHQKDMA